MTRAKTLGQTFRSAQEIEEAICVLLESVFPTRKGIRLLAVTTLPG
ncbi:MAG: hypothetical protein AAAB20_12300 [Rhizobium sp.]